MRKTEALWIIGLVLLCGSLGLAGEWRVGIARTDITPAKLLWMRGYSARKHPAEGTLHPLWAKALVIEDRHRGRAVIVTADLVGIYRPMADAVGARVHKRTGIERERIVLSASHTHCGPVTLSRGVPVTYPLNAKDLADVKEYTQTLEDKVVKLIEEACGNMRPAKLAYGEGEATFARNRRNHDGPVDHVVPVLQVSDENNRLLAALFGYACHNVTFRYDCYRFNGDYAGFAQIAFEAAHPGATAMFMAGCGGDSNPIPNRTGGKEGWKERYRIKLAEQYGKSLAGAVDGALSEKLHPVEGPLSVAFERVDLPFVDPPTKEDLQKHRGGGSGWLESLGPPRGGYDQRLTEVLLKRIEEQGSLETAYPCPVQVVRFGEDLSLIALPGEPVVDYVLRLRKEFEGRRIWVAGYSNELFAYLPSERVLAEGGYEGAWAMRYYGWHGPFKPGLEDRVVGLVKKLMEQ